MNKKRASYFVLVIIFVAGINCGIDDTTTPAGPVDPGDTLTNHPPVMRAQPNTSAVVGDTLILFAHAEDEDGDSLIYGMNNFIIKYFQYNKAHADIDPVTGEFHFYVRATDVPAQAFEFYAVDIECASDTTSFFVNVSSGR